MHWQTTAVASGALDTVSGPRLGAELRLLAEQGDPVRGFLVLSELGSRRGDRAPPRDR